MLSFLVSTILIIATTQIIFIFLFHRCEKIRIKILNNEIAFHVIDYFWLTFGIASVVLAIYRNEIDKETIEISSQIEQIKAKRDDLSKFLSNEKCINEQKNIYPIFIQEKVFSFKDKLNEKVFCQWIANLNNEIKYKYSNNSSFSIHSFHNIDIPKFFDHKGEKRNISESDLTNSIIFGQSAMYISFAQNIKNHLHNSIGELNKYQIEIRSKESKLAVDKQFSSNLFDLFKCFFILFLTIRLIKVTRELCVKLEARKYTNKHTIN